MVVTPSEIFELALARHREPWNWTIQFAALALLCLTLLAHSYLLLAATLIFFGTGFFNLNLGTPPDSHWFRLVGAVVEWEKNWAGAPWNWHKVWRFGCALCIAATAIWSLWVRELAAIGLLIGFGALAKVVMDNKKKGVEP